MLWTHYTGVAHYVIHGTQYVAGLVLALLGLLDIGGKHFDINAEDNLKGTNPFYHLVAEKWPLGIIAMIYFFVYFAPMAWLTWWHRRKGGIWDDEEVGGHKDEAGGAHVNEKTAVSERERASSV
jgi:hypothetical protein